MTKSEAALKLAYLRGNLEEELGCNEEKVGVHPREDLSWMEKNRKGDMAEMLACAWLMRHGYEVFRNVGCTGKADLMIYKPGKKAERVDVKCIRFEKDGEVWKIVSNKNKVARGVTPLYVDPETFEVSFHLKDFRGK
jgi:hypothetical protein